MVDIARLAQTLVQQKRKYHAKVLSSDALYANWLRSMDLEPLLPEYVWLVIPEFTYAGIAFSILFDIPPAEIIPVNWDFQVELPTTEELEQGILAVVNRFDWSSVYEWLSDIDKLIIENFEPEAAEQIINSRPRKAIYGVSPFDTSYYDPPAVREALRSTFHKLWVERRTLQHLRSSHDALAETLGVSPGFLELVFNKISQVFFAQPSTMILGYGVLGRSFLGDKARPEPLARIKMVDHRLELLEWLGNTLDHTQIGLVLGIVPLGYGFLLPPRSVMKKPLTPEQLLPLTVFVHDRGWRNIHTFTWNPFTFGNYNRPEEMTDWRRSERADQYMSLQVIRYQIEHIVENIVSQYEDNPIRIRMYKNAALQLVSLPVKRHAWGHEAYRAMTEDELREYWLRNWEAQGLNRDVLLAVYNAIWRWLPEWRRLMLQLGRRVRETRYMRARLR